MASSPADTSFRTVVGVLQLLRPLNLALALAGVMVGACLSVGWLAFTTPHIGSVMLAALSAAAVTSAANAINDAFDVKVDRVNRPDRPIPAGRITAKAANWTWLISAILAVGFSLLLSAAHVLIVAASIVTVYAYSAVLKRLGLVGNIAVATIVAASIVFGALAVGEVGKAWAGAGLALLLTLAREITKDLEDVEGDVQDDVRTLAVSIGHEQTRTIAVGLILATIFVAPLPFLLLGFDRMYLFGIAVADACLLGAIWQLWVADDRKETYSRASLLLKSSMVAGLGALLLA